MYQLLAFLSGAFISLMILLNGSLGNLTGVTFSLFIIHIIGIVITGILIVVRKEKLDVKGVPIFLFFGGLLGVVIVGSQTISIAKIGLSSTIMLVLASQIVTSGVYDSFFSGKEKKESPNFLKLLSFVVIFAGVIVMTQKGA